MHTFEGGFVQHDMVRVLVYPSQRIAIAADLFFVAVFEKRFCGHQHTLYAGSFEGNAFNSIRGDGALDQRVFTKHLELLRGLPRIQFLLAAEFASRYQAALAGIEKPGRENKANVFIWMAIVPSLVPSYKGSYPHRLPDLTQAHQWLFRPEWGRECLAEDRRVFAQAEPLRTAVNDKNSLSPEYQGLKEIQSMVEDPSNSRST